MNYHLEMLHTPRTALLLVLVLQSVFALRAAPTNSVTLIEISIGNEQVEALKKAPRKDVSISIRMDGQARIPVRAHLKGHGSFRPISGKPSWSIRSTEKNLLGRKKLLLNNSSQDASFLKWKIASEVFVKAGVPAPEVSFAKVRLNNRELGLYVMVEPTDKQFLKKHFGSAQGNLYEGSNHDVNEPLELDSGKPETAQKDLKLLADACRQPDVTNRWSRLGEVLDLERFISFMAAEVLVGHRDGYSLDRNNFRLYCDPSSNKFVFIPHGMDLLFTKADAPLEPHFSGMVAASVLETPQGQAAYRSRVQALAKQFFGNQDLLSRVKQLSEAIGPNAGTQGRAAAQELIKVIKARMEYALKPLR